MALLPRQGMLVCSFAMRRSRTQSNSSGMAGPVRSESDDHWIGLPNSWGMRSMQTVGGERSRPGDLPG